MSLSEISFHLNKKRERLRDLLHDRHITSYAFVNVRMSNVYDWSWRMATKIKQANKKEKKKAEFRGFFNVELNAEQKAEAKVYIRNDENVAIEIENALASGYKITVSKDGRTDGYQASLQCNDAESENAGLCMSAYANHWYSALGVLMFKHNVVLNKHWEQYEASPEDTELG